MKKYKHIMPLLRMLSEKFQPIVGGVLAQPSKLLTKYDNDGACSG